MQKKNVVTFITLVSLLSPLYAAETTAWDLFNWLEEGLGGEWKLSSPEEQLDTQSYRHPAVLPLAGTETTAISFKLIGGEVTIQEDLLPRTAKQMVTMYHCKDIACTNLKATHYCSKQNQPEFLANLQESTANRIIFECDMSTELCQSDEDHIHKIIHELSNDGKHLKSSYLAWKDKKLHSSHSIYHFDKK